jgi:predicted RNA-binding protein with PUA-like domain
VVGVARVVKEHYPDPTTDDDRWVVVDLAPVRKLDKPVTLSEIKADPRLEGLALIKHSRLSVIPVDRAHYDLIISKSI